VSRWAQDNDEGLHAYLVITTDMWQAARGTDYRRIEYAASLAEAKSQFGWTREHLTTVRVRRATPDDVLEASR
jgi:hypothetical protein